MADFFQGTRGSGKTKLAVSRIEDRLKRGCRVATNLDLFLDKLVPNSSTVVTRLPDFPRSIDLKDLGPAYPELNPDNPDTYDKKRFGLIVLDEVLTFFNSRSWNDPDRLNVVNWLVQSRKMGWDLILIGQDNKAIDKQMRASLIDNMYYCSSGQKMFGGLFGNVLMGFYAILTFGRPFPKFHKYSCYASLEKKKSTYDSFGFYKKDYLHSCYKTSQQFTKDITVNKAGKVIDMRASYSLIPASKLAEIYDCKKSKPTKKIENNKDTNKKNWRFWVAKACYLTAILVPLFGFGIIDNPFAAESESDVETQTDQNPKPQTPSRPQSAPDNHSPTLEPVDYYISGSVRSNNGGDYVFHNSDGLVFYPENVGYSVTWVNKCKALLSKDNHQFFVYCNPTFDYSELELALKN